MTRTTPANWRSSAPRLIGLTGFLLLAPLTGCGAQIDHHGHVFMDVDMQQVQPGMSKEQVQQAFGSPDTTSTIGGDAFYYISTTQKTYAFFKPWEIDRQVVAVYFDQKSSVQQVAHYGMKDGIVVNFASGETPARGKDMSLVEQILGNVSQRKLFKDQTQGGGVPGPGL